MKFYRASAYILSALVLSACGGEPSAPPATPPPPPAAAAPETSPVASATPAATPAPAEAAASSTPAAAPAAATRGTISGTVNVTPANLGKNAVVYLVDAPKEPGATMTASIDQKGMTFIPTVSVIAAGGTVHFLNSDPFPHNVFSPDQEKFNLGTIAHGGKGSRPFEKTGAYTLLCNLHPGMLGYVYVAPSSYFAKADATGHYSIKDVPSGTYKISAWVPRLPEETQPVTVAGGDTTIDFHLHR